MMKMTKTGIAMVLALSTFLAGNAFAATKTLSFALPLAPTGSRVHQTWEWWADTVKEKTGGSVEVKIYYMQSLVKLKDAAQAVTAGIADLAYMSPAYTPDKLPLWYMENTRIGSSDPYVVTEAFRRVRENFPPLREEEKKNNMKYVVHLSNGPQVLISKTHPYTTPDDFQGDKVRMPGTMAKVAKMADWKVDPVSLYFSEIYSAMGRGTIDGAMTYVPLIGPNSQNEVSKYVVEPKVGQNSNVVMMNLNSWQRLSEKEQAVFDGLRTELMVRLARAGIEDEAEQRELLKNDPDNPLIFQELTPAQRQAWEKGLALGDDEMIKQMSRWNRHAGDLHQAYKEEIEKVAREVEAEGYPWDRQRPQ